MSPGMSRVEFHYNVADKLAYSCRLLRKVLANELQAVVVAPEPVLRALDAALWSLGPSEFLPHCLAGAPAATRQASPIWLAEAWPADASRRLLLNLGQEVPAQFERASRHLEVVSTDPDDAEAGRLRWRHYKAMGLALERHDRLGQD